MLFFSSGCSAESKYDKSKLLLSDFSCLSIDNQIEILKKYFHGVRRLRWRTCSRLHVINKRLLQVLVDVLIVYGATFCFCDSMRIATCLFSRLLSQQAIENMYNFMLSQIGHLIDGKQTESTHIQLWRACE